MLVRQCLEFSVNLKSNFCILSKFQLFAIGFSNHKLIKISNFVAKLARCLL